MTEIFVRLGIRGMARVIEISDTEREGFIKIESGGVWSFGHNLAAVGAIVFLSPVASAAESDGAK